MREKQWCLQFEWQPQRDRREVGESGLNFEIDSKQLFNGFNFKVSE